MFRIIEQPQNTRKQGTDTSIARRGEYHTKHGVIQTPVFMNVATQGAIKGALSSVDLKEIGCQVALCNTYHLHVRPGDELIKKQGGLHKFMAWDGPILTDSGGFQIFSLAKLRKISEEGVTFNSHTDGRKIFMSPEDSMQIQLNLGSDMIMAFDECVEIPSPYEYVKESCELTYRWLLRCKEELKRCKSGSEISRAYTGKSVEKSTGKATKPSPIGDLFGINQGAAYKDLRIEHMKKIADLDLPGYAIGGLAVGETTEQMYETIEAIEPYMPKDKPRYLMGVGTPQNIVEAVARGVDFFDCVMPARNGRHGKLYTWGSDDEVDVDGETGFGKSKDSSDKIGRGTINILNKCYENDERPIDIGCDCSVCKTFSRAYIRHLFKSDEMLAMRLSVMHNLYYYNTLMEKIRNSIEVGTFESLRRRINALN